MSRNLGSFLVFGALILSLPLFQNCANTSFLGIETSSSKPVDLSSSDNGGGYSGKLAGEFYRFDPDFKCEGKPSAVSSIVATASAINYTENRRLACGAVHAPLLPTDIDRSVYQNDIIGHREGIFESETAAPSSIPPNLVEVWCKDSLDPATPETITHFNRITKESVTKIYYTVGGTAKMIPDFSTPMKPSQQQVLVKDGHGFELTVFRNKPATLAGLPQATGQFQAKLTAIIEGKSISKNTFCRLGGTLDAKLWPAKQIIDSSISLLKLAPDFKTLAFSSPTGTGIENLFSGDLMGTTQQQIAPPMLMLGVKNFEFAPNSQSLLYWGDSRSAGMVELFSVSKNGQSVLPLSQPLTQQTQTSRAWYAQLPMIQFSRDGSKVFYEDGSLNNVMDPSMNFKTVPALGGSPLWLGPPLPMGDNEVTYFEVSTAVDKVAVLSAAGTPFMPDLYLANFDNSDLTKMDLPSPSPGGWLIAPIDPLEMTAGGHYVIVTRRNRTVETLSTAVSFATKAAVSFPPGWVVESSNLADTFVLLRNPTQPSAVKKLAALTSGNSVDLAGLENPQFGVKNSNALLALQRLPDQRLQAVIMSLSGQTVQPVCSQVASPNLTLSELDSGDLLVSAYDSTTGILSLYLSTSAGCTKVNAVPVDGVDFLKASLSADQQKILLQFSNHLYFVPLSGEPVLQVDSPVYAGAKIVMALLLPDSHSVFYTGDQISAGEFGGFLWSTP